MHDLVPSTKCIFSAKKTIINIEKTLARATCFDSNAPHNYIQLFFENVRINIITIKYNLSLNIK